MNRNIIICLVFGMSLFLMSCKTQNKKQCYIDKIYSGIEFEMPKVIEPEFPDYSVNIKDFGGVPDGQTLNTKAFEDAINHVAEKGGGSVIVPRGIWLTGPIVFKSNINLHIEEGALILFSRNFDHYKLIPTSFEGLVTYRCISPIYGDSLENIAITGRGIIDGNGDAWRQLKKSKVTENHWKKVINSGGVVDESGTKWYPSEGALKGSKISDMNVPKGDLTHEDYMEIKDFLRPVMVSFKNCKNILLEDATFQNSPAWNIHPLMCENVTLRNVTVRNPWYSQNGDGLDLESCKNSIIYKCRFDVGDDAICIKSGKDKDGRMRGMPTENAIIKECIVYHGHGGFVIGSEMSGGVKNMHVSNCTFIGTDVGLRFKSTRGRGGIVENIYISNIDMINIPTEAIRFNLYYTGNSPVPEDDQEVVDVKKLASMLPEVTEETPQFKNIFMKNIVCKGARRAIYMQGLPEMNLKNFVIENVNIVADYGIECIDADSIQLKNVTVKPAKGPVVSIHNSKNISLQNFNYEYDNTDVVKITGAFTNNITIENEKLKSNNELIKIGINVPENAVKFE